MLKSLIPTLEPGRNISQEQRTYLLGKRYKGEKKQQGGTGINQHTEQSVQNAHSTKTAEIIAKQNNTNESTVRRNEKFADGIDKIAIVNPELKEEILSGSSDAETLLILKVTCFLRQPIFSVISQADI